MKKHGLLNQRTAASRPGPCRTVLSKYQKSPSPWAFYQSAAQCCCLMQAVVSLTGFKGSICTRKIYCIRVDNKKYSILIKAGPLYHQPIAETLKINTALTLTHTWQQSVIWTTTISNQDSGLRARVLSSVSLTLTTCFNRPTQHVPSI